LDEIPTVVGEAVIDGIIEEIGIVAIGHDTDLLDIPGQKIF